MGVWDTQSLAPGPAYPGLLSRLSGPVGNKQPGVRCSSPRSRIHCWGHLALQPPGSLTWLPRLWLEAGKSAWRCRPPDPDVGRFRGTQPGPLRG